MNSRSREVWVQCQMCQKWAHDDCTKNSQGSYIQTASETVTVAGLMLLYNLDVTLPETAESEGLS